MKKIACFDAFNPQRIRHGAAQRAWLQARSWARTWSLGQGLQWWLGLGSTRRNRWHIGL